MCARMVRRPVWVVDDSHLDAERARAALAADYDLELFHDGAQAIEALTSMAPPDVLVLDWVMPAVNGLDVLRFLRSTRDFDSVSVLLLTVQNDTEHAVTALDAGASDFLTKPFAAAELRARVEAMMRSRALTERAERAELALRSMLDTWSGALVTLDKNGIVRFANEAAAALMHRSQRDVPGHSLEELMGPDVTAELLTVQRRHGTRDVRVRDRLFEARARPLVDVGLGTIVLTLNDVTEVRRAEEERRDFYAIVAHDMRSPLFSMLLRAELLIEGVKGPMPPAAVGELRRMKEQIGRMSTLMKDFLELAKLGEASPPLTTTPLDIDALVKDVASEFQPLLAAYDLTWQHQAARVPCVAQADGSRLRQAVMNLFVNAANYTPAGGVVTTSSQQHEGMVEVAIEDTGPGIEASEIPHLFERYRRSTSSGKTAGTGLGLMIVRRVIEAHGGEVGVDSRPGCGSRFWFRLPVASAGARDASADERPAAGG